MSQLSPLNDLKDGESKEILSSSGSTYRIKNSGGVFSCTCPAWRNQRVSIECRTCKHIIAFRGKDAEDYRVAQAWARSGVTMPADRPHKPESDASPDAQEGGKTVIWKPMLAQIWNSAVDPAGWYMSEKLDGVRAYWDGTQFWSRQNNKYFAPAWFLEGFPPFPLDGELFGGRKQFQVTVSIVRRQDASDLWKQIRYRVFDVPEDGSDFETRIQKAHAWFGDHHPPYAEILEQVTCTGRDHLQAELTKVIKLGGEGIMLRKPKSPYEHARTSCLLKVKTKQDAEAKVIGYTQGTGKYADGMIGALQVEMPNGFQFKIGTGLSDEDRLHPPPIGSVVTYQFQELSNDGIPRFPVFLRTREDAEWEDVQKDNNNTPTGNAAIKIPTGIPVNSPQNPANLPPTATEYYEFNDPATNSAKFWEVSINGKVVSVSYGRIGSAGQEKLKEFATETEAVRFAEKKRNEKLKEGYIRAQRGA